MMRPAGEAVAEQSNFKIRAANETATASATATAVLWKDLNGNGYDKEDGLKNGHNGNSKDHLKSGPQWSENWEHLTGSSLCFLDGPPVFLILTAWPPTGTYPSWSARSASGR